MLRSTWRHWLTFASSWRKDVVEHFKSQPTKLFKEAMQYSTSCTRVLEPTYHCFYYFEVLNVRKLMHA